MSGSRIRTRLVVTRGDGPARSALHPRHPGGDERRASRPTGAVVTGQVTFGPSRARPDGVHSVLPTPGCRVRGYLANLGSLWRSAADEGRQGLAFALFDRLTVDLATLGLSGKPEDEFTLSRAIPRQATAVPETA